MRIVAGRWRGRALAAPPGTKTRPTSDRARQALFDVLAHASWSPGLIDLTVLDAFAGTGALGLEALSRGARLAVFIENDRAAVAAIRTNISACGAEARVIAADVTRVPAADRAADLVFLDPPYGQALIGRAVTALAAAGWITPDTLLVAESGRDEEPPSATGMLDTRTHGAAQLWFWRAG